MKPIGRDPRLPQRPVLDRGKSGVRANPQHVKAERGERRLQVANERRLAELLAAHEANRLPCTNVGEQRIKFFGAQNSAPPSWLEGADE